MSKKDSKPKLGQDPLAWIKNTAEANDTPNEQTEPAEEKASQEPKRRTGRPTTIKRKLDKTSQANLPDKWTRATFIVHEDLLDNLKDLAYTERKTITDVINEAIEQYTAGKEIIKRELKK